MRRKSEVYIYLSSQIIELRQKRNYTQKDLARMLRTTQQTISRIEHPYNCSMSVNTLLRVAEVFDKDLKIEFI